MVITGVIIEYEDFPGSCSDDYCLEKSESMRHVREPSNPYDLPAMLSFGDGTVFAQAVFLTDLTLQDGFSPYVMSVTGIPVANYVRLDIERLFGRMVAVHRFFLEQTWTEPSHDLNLMAECAIKLTNYLARMPESNDRRHVLSIATASQYSNGLSFLILTAYILTVLSRVTRSRQCAKKVAPGTDGTPLVHGGRRHEWPRRGQKF